MHVSLKTLPYSISKHSNFQKIPVGMLFPPPTSFGIFLMLVCFENVLLNNSIMTAASYDMPLALEYCSSPLHNVVCHYGDKDLRYMAQLKEVVIVDEHVSLVVWCTIQILLQKLTDSICKWS